MPTEHKAYPFLHYGSKGVTCVDYWDIVRPSVRDLDEVMVIMVKPRSLFLPLMQMPSAEVLWFGDPDQLRSGLVHNC